MKALMLKEYKHFVYEEVACPEPKENEVLIRVMACAVCGSDVHGMDGSTGRRIPPIIMGHEASGIIERCGSKVSHYRCGDRVTFDSTIYCGECDMCETGTVNLCRNRRVLGVSCDDYRLNGAFAEFVVVPEYVLYRLPDHVNFRQAAMVEPLSVAYHAATRTPIGKDSSVMIVGVGTIGLLIMQVVKSMGARQIVAVDIDNDRLAAATVMGATDCINSKDQDALRNILSATEGGTGVAVAIDATGIPATFDLCLKAVGLNGKVVLVGNLAKSVDLPLQWIVTRQLSIFGSCASAGEYDKCLNLIASRNVDVDSMISACVPLSQGGEWIERLYNREKGLYKIVLIPNHESEQP